MIRYNSHDVFRRVADLGTTATMKDAMDIFDSVKERPIERLEASEGTVYGTTYYTVEPIGGYWLRMEDWAVQTFGDPGSIWDPKQKWSNSPAVPGARWYMNNRKFWFRDEADRTMFMLKWA